MGRAVEDRNEVAQIKYFFHDSFTTRQIRVRDPLVSYFKQVTFTRRLLTDSSRIRKDFCDFSITSLQTASRAPCYLLGMASDLRDRKQEERLNAIKSSEFRPSPVYCASSTSFLYNPSRGPLSSRRPLIFFPVFPLSHVYGRAGRSLLKRVFRFISVVRLRMGFARR